ncbi:MAG: hypothetical protein QOJ00_2512, partial [Actinomycetota bacterium]
RRYPGVYWTHNDSGGKPEVFALTVDGSDLGSYAFPGAKAVDWEDIGIGPKRGASGSYIYAADIGDNAALLPVAGRGRVRDFVTVYRAPEPAVAPKAPGSPLTGVEHFNLIYPGGPEDAETLIVDPISGDLVIVTKSLIGSSRILVAPAASLSNGATITMREVGTIHIVAPAGAASKFPGTLVTGGDISSDGSLILLRTYAAVLAFARAPGQSVPDALLGVACNAPQVSEDQGEAIAIAADTSRYVTISEGASPPVNVFPIAPAAARSATTVSTATTRARTAVGARHAAPAGNNAERGAVAAVLLLAVLLAVRRLRVSSRSSAG